MTTDELIDLGHKAGTLFVTQFGVASVTVEWLENFAALVAAAERDRMCEQFSIFKELAHEKAKRDEANRTKVLGKGR